MFGIAKPSEGRKTSGHEQGAHVLGGRETPGSPSCLSISSADTWFCPLMASVVMLIVPSSRISHLMVSFIA
jgi:hypothetical protein